MNISEHLDDLVDRFIKEESIAGPNPFIATRIMAAVDKGNRWNPVQMIPVWRIAMMSLLLALAVFAGINAGNLYSRSTAGNSTVLINDDAMEHFDFYAGVDE